MYVRGMRDDSMHSMPYIDWCMQILQHNKLAYNYNNLILGWTDTFQSQTSNYRILILHEIHRSHIMHNLLCNIHF